MVKEAGCNMADVNGSYCHIDEYAEEDTCLDCIECGECPYYYED